jgi:TolB-like protein
MIRILEEIRRRKVGRVAVAYAAAAFVVLQVADIVLPALDAPGWVLTVLVVIAALGFPVAVALAWAFDVTADGVQRTPPAAPASAGARLLDRRGAAVVAVVAMVSVGAGGSYLWSRYAGAADLDPDLVVILPFRVSADPSIAYLREGMVDLLATSLSAESGLRAAEPRTALSAWRRVARDESIDLAADDAKQVARAVGAGQVVLGSVLGTGREVTLTASLIRLGGGRSIEARAQGDADGITRLIDELCAQLLSRAAGESETRLEALTSTSLPALRAYLEGQVHYRRSQFGRAAHAFDRAVDIDSTFALAALHLDMMIGWGDGRTPNQERSARLVHRYRDRLSPLDRLLFDAHVGADYPRMRTQAEILADWERALTRLPERADALFLYGDELFHYGSLVDRPDHLGAALRAFDRALAIDSSFTPALIHLLDAALYRGDAESARRLFDLLARSDTTAETAAYQYYSRLVAFGDTAQLEAFRRGLDTMSTHIRRMVGLAFAITTGEPADARAAVALNLSQAMTPQEREQALTDAYRMALTMGRPTEAAGYAEQALASGADAARWRSNLVLDALFWNGDRTSAERAVAALRQTSQGEATSSHVECTLGQWSAWHEDFEGATSHAVRRERLSVDGDATETDRACALVIRATVAVLSGAPDAAVLLERADSAAVRGPLDDYPLLRAINFSLSRLHELSGSLERALTAASRYVMVPIGMIGYSSSVWERARLAEMLGDHAAAREAYAQYLRMQHEPEPALLPRQEAAEVALLRLSAERAN